ncbi:unnamed protein product [Aphanomyces euteiches]|uniref:Amino acid permease/ SLC12A domain-containing protein n=1 Tax=Aphanomyces euteiches TaxID=100861 RepID=A0A6G0XSW2_9STRA|nr:hypothetical protein Ae201684_001775 [Aphanomyces euteiches]KAH9071877.1 hypothetical protein Ae201684P_020136 [Aphanomyces euteiches]KAH9141589.1 hypothetical protein AeRB84_014245 [Aphanomyces euteiches]
MQVAPHTLDATKPTPVVQRARSSYDLWAIGITIVIGGQFFGWNGGVAAGSVGFGIAVVLVGLAYVCLACSMAEMTSMLPFAGGVYGLARCTLGFYAAFVLGCCELLEYVMYSASINVALGRSVISAVPSLESYAPLIWFISHIFTLVLLCIGGRFFWRCNFVMAVIMIVVVAIYCFGSLPYTSWSANAGTSDNNLFQGGFEQFFASFPMAMWFFVGVEALNTLSNEVDDPKNTIPRGQVAAAFTLFVSALLVYVVTLGLPPGVAGLPNVLVIFNSGFTQIFKINDTQATMFSLVAEFVEVPGFLFAASNIFVALSESRLFPHELCYRSHRFGTPIYASMGVTLLSFVLCFGVTYQPDIDVILYCMSMFFGTLTYTSQCVGYLFLKKRYRTMERTFKSPLGIYGPAFSIVVFVMCAISIVAFQPGSPTARFSIVSLLVLLSVYYHGYAKSRQTFSDEERKVLFFAHIAIHNNSKHKHRSNLRRLMDKLLSRVSAAMIPTEKTNAQASERSPNKRDIL